MFITHLQPAHVLCPVPILVLFTRFQARDSVLSSASRRGRARLQDAITPCAGSPSRRRHQRCALSHTPLQLLPDGVHQIFPPRNSRSTRLFGQPTVPSHVRRVKIATPRDGLQRNARYVLSRAPSSCTPLTALSTVRTILRAGVQDALSVACTLAALDEARDESDARVRHAQVRSQYDSTLR